MENIEEKTIETVYGYKIKIDNFISFGGDPLFIAKVGDRLYTRGPDGKYRIIPIWPKIEKSKN